MQNDLIKNQIETFVQKLDLLVRQSVLDHLKAVLSGSAGGGGDVPAPAKRGRPVGSGKGRRGRKPADLGDALQKMVDYVKSNDGQGISAIAAATGIDLKVAKKAALQLLAAKALKKSGQKRGTVYHLGSGSVPAAGEAAPAKAGKKRGRKKA